MPDRTPEEAGRKPSRTRDLRGALVGVYPTSCGTSAGTRFHLGDPHVLWERPPGCCVILDCRSDDEAWLTVMGRTPATEELARFVREHGEASAQGGHHGGLTITVARGDFERIERLAGLLELGQARQPDSCSPGVPQAVATLRELAQRLRAHGASEPSQNT